MKVLLTAASQHGATTEVAEAIARRLKADGLEVVCKPPQDVDSLEGFDAVICGSAVYMTQWMPAAHDFMERFAQELHKLPVWAFSVGMNGVPKHVPQDPSRIGPCSRVSMRRSCVLLRDATILLFSRFVRGRSFASRVRWKAISVTGMQSMIGLTALLKS